VVLKPGSQTGPPIAPQGISEANRQHRLRRCWSSGFTPLGGTLREHPNQVAEEQATSIQSGAAQLGR
jgi:hypothetical protein